ncbi:hypothetical protein AB0C87_30395 [Actinomadura sp. NPDC048021]
MQVRPLLQQLDGRGPPPHRRSPAASVLARRGPLLPRNDDPALALLLRHL